MLGLKALVDHVEVSPASPQMPVKAWTPVRIAPQTQSPGASHRPTLVLPPIASMDARTRQHSVPALDPRAAAAPETTECSHRVFLGRKNKRDEDRMNALSSSSPTAVWEGEAASSRSPSAQSNDTLRSSPSTTLQPLSSSSPPSTTDTRAHETAVQQPPAIHPQSRMPAWRAPPLAVPRSSAPHTHTIYHGAASTPSTTIQMPAAKRPMLVRKTSSNWRQEMPRQDRDKTRERIRRGLHNQCDEDFDLLLHIVAAMEEELLHVQTTSRDHYFLQAMALHDRIVAVGDTTPSS
ncbi:hypothetical protein PINS_up007310 [Pythium insidiosum]|nr:hypothetical protein PINS_up007310 [Pythium insidiosum]